jgi:RHS repeat-associated protein
VNRTLAYDANTQLISATNPEAPQTVMQSETFNYDPISNRTQDEGGTYTYDSHSQRLIQDYRYTYIYDKNGNLSSKQEVGTGIGTDGIVGEVTNYFYSSENQLLGFKVYPAASASPSKEVTYVYNALGNRIGKKVIDHAAPSDLTKTFSRGYAYDGKNILLEFDGSNNLLAKYTHSPFGEDVLAADVTSSGVTAMLAQNAGGYMYLKDQLGAITDIADTSGNLVQHYVYSAYGQLLQIRNAAGADVTSGPLLATSFTFTGREYDSESGLYYYRARYYDPGTGRFLQKDPSPGKLTIPVSVVNSYAYVGNNPANMTDPSGASFLSGLIDDLIIGLVAGLAAAFVVGTLGVGLLAGVLIGAAIGAVAGGVTGGILSVIQGGSFAAGFMHGAIVGAMSGAIAGGFAGASNAANATTSPGADSSRVQPATSTANAAIASDPANDVASGGDCWPEWEDLKSTPWDPSKAKILIDCLGNLIVPSGPTPTPSPSPGSAIG